jgi:threonine dehydrogenase-like Zn-dependent dehydrogenase
MSTTRSWQTEQTTPAAGTGEGLTGGAPFAPQHPSANLRQRKASPPQNMRAAVIAEPRTVEIREVPIPKSGPAQMLVRVEGCGVCASNVPVWEGKPWFSYPLAPGQLGHEGWGRIVKKGAELTGFQVGGRVAFISNHAYAEYDIADATSAVLLPAELDQQPFPGEPLACALNIFHRSCIDIDDTVAIVGIGFLGALLVELATSVGARVIAIARRPFAVNIATELGAAHAISMNDESRIIAQVKQLTHGQFCDVVIEATGKQWPLDLAAEITRERGRLVIAGYHQDGKREVNMQLWNWRGIDVINAHERDPLIYRDGIRQAVAALEDHLLDPAPLYTHRFPLRQLDKAFTMAAERPDGFMKALVMME